MCIWKSYCGFCVCNILPPLITPIRSDLLLLENVAPFCSDEVPGQRHSHNVPGDVLNGRGGILLAYLSRVKCVVQIPGSKETSYSKDIIFKHEHNASVS